MEEANKNRDFIINIMKDSLESLYNNDKDLFIKNEGRGLSERCLVFRFAHYLQKKLDSVYRNNPYFVDCDYNSANDFRKNEQISGKPIPNLNGHEVKRFIDIIVHKRRSGGNSDYFCIEVKKWNNKHKGLEKDRNNLKHLTKEFNYDYGFSLILGKELNTSKLEMFERENEPEDISNIFNNN